jgi:hypothetical protein
MAHISVLPLTVPHICRSPQMWVSAAISYTF